MQTADVRDAARASWWKLRQTALAMCHWLGFSRWCSSPFTADPESCGSMFRWIVIRVCDAVLDQLPIDIILTPENVSEFCGPDSAGYTIASRAQRDPAEAWRRLRKCLRKDKNAIGPHIVGCGRKYRLIVNVEAEGEDRVRFKIERGPTLAHPEHIEG